MDGKAKALSGSLEPRRFVDRSAESERVCLRRHRIDNSEISATVSRFTCHLADFDRRHDRPNPDMELIFLFANPT